MSGTVTPPNQSMELSNSYRLPLGNSILNSWYRPLNDADKQNGVINQTIPVELLMQILGYLSPSNLASARGVCRYWEYLVSDFAPQEAMRRLDRFPLFQGIATMPVDPDAMEIDHETIIDTKASHATVKINFVWEQFRLKCRQFRMRPPAENPIFLSPQKIEQAQDRLLKRHNAEVLLRFCDNLPDWVKETLPSLSTPGLTPLTRASRARIELAISDEVAELVNYVGYDLHELPPEIRHFPSLQVLDLNANTNHIPFLPDEIGQLVNLTQLGLDGVGLEELTPAIGNCIHLTHLYLGSNQFRTLPDVFGNFTEMEEIYLTGNENLEELPASIGNLPALQKFCMSNTRVRILPASFNNLTALVHCGLEGNQLEGLPNGFGLRQTVLEELYINNNRITELPGSLRFLDNVTTLDASDNLLETVPEGLGRLLNLNLLNLKNNRLTTLPGSFRQFPQLQYLHLENNLFVVFPAVLLEMASLGNLTLDNNQIAELPEDFDTMTNLFDLSMMNNQLTNLPASLKRLRLHFEGNPLQIDQLPADLLEHLLMLRQYGTGGF